MGKALVTYTTALGAIRQETVEYESMYIGGNLIDFTFKGEHKGKGWILPTQCIHEIEYEEDKGDIEEIEE